MGIVNLSFYQAATVSQTSVIMTKGAVSDQITTSASSVTSTESCPFRDQGLVELNTDVDVWFKIGEPAVAVEGVFLKAGVPKVVWAYPGATVSVIEA